MRMRRAGWTALALALALGTGEGAAYGAQPEGRPVEERAESLNAAAAKKVKKNGLKYEKGNYYYYRNGVKVKKKWVTIKGYRYYFGAGGAAYRGKKNYGVNEYKVAKIGKYYYGFDLKGRMLRGTYVIKEKFYVFTSKNGQMNRTTSAKLRAACKYGADTGVLKRLLKNIGQKPVSSNTSAGCYGDGGEDVVYAYKNFRLSAHKNGDGTEIFFGVSTR